jgi:hypothetical protein
MLEAGALHDRLETAPHRLDLRKLWHSIDPAGHCDAHQRAPVGTHWRFDR